MLSNDFSKPCLIVLSVSLFSPITWADPNYILSASYAPVTWVKGDIDEDEVAPDQYSRFDLNPGSAIAIRWRSVDSALYVDYTRIDTESTLKTREKRKFQSITTGFFIYEDKYLNDSLDYYFIMSGGVGLSRFDIHNTEYEATAEIGLEGGIAIEKNLSIGIGFKFQSVGYPTETVANVFYPSVTLSARFW